MLQARRPCSAPLTPTKKGATTLPITIVPLPLPTQGILGSRGAGVLGSLGLVFFNAATSCEC